MDWPTTVLGLGVCALIAFLSGRLPGLLQDIGDTVPVADLRPDPPLRDPVAYADTALAQAQAIRSATMAQTGKRLDHAYALGYDKGYHDACSGLPKDHTNGSGVVTITDEQSETLRRMRESEWYKRHQAFWTGDTRG